MYTGSPLQLFAAVKLEYVKLLMLVQAGVWYQKCYDPECRLYRSEAMPLPPQLAAHLSSRRTADAQAVSVDLLADPSRPAQESTDFSASSCQPATCPHAAARPSAGADQCEAVSQPQACPSAICRPEHGIGITSGSGVAGTSAQEHDRKGTNPDGGCKPLEWEQAQAGVLADTSSDDDLDH